MIFPSGLRDHAQFSFIRHEKYNGSGSVIPSVKAGHFRLKDFALSLGGWVGYARLVRAQVLAAREREFVEAARALGATDLRIVVRHILPNIIQPVIVQAAIGMAGAILAEATMSFLGLGVPPPTASWGAMLNDSRSHLFDSPHLVLFPAAAVMLAVLSFNFIGDALRDLLDPRSRIEAGL